MFMFTIFYLSVVSYTVKVWFQSESIFVLMHLNIALKTSNSLQVFVFQIKRTLWSIMCLYCHYFLQLFKLVYLLVCSESIKTAIQKSLCQISLIASEIGRHSKNRNICDWLLPFLCFIGVNFILDLPVISTLSVKSNFAFQQFLINFIDFHKSLQID